MKHTSGNVIFIVLIAIALFGALAMTLTKSLSGVNESRITKQRAKAAAAAIIKYGSDIQQAISRMQLVNNCSDTEISFERSPFDGSDTLYLNPNSPSDLSCHVFHPNGGGASWMNIDNDWIKGSNLPKFYGEFFFSGYDCIYEIGSTGNGGTNCVSDTSTEDAELLILLTDLNDDICKAINIINGISNTPNIPQSNWGSRFYSASENIGAFKGIYGYVTNLNRNGQFGAQTMGRKTACTNDMDAGNTFYHVLLAR